MVSINSLPDKRRYLDIITSAFTAAPGINWMFGSRPLAFRLREFFRYCLSFACSKNGAFISTNRRAIVLLHDLSCHHQSVGCRLRAAFLFIYVLGPLASIRVMRCKKLVAARRPSEGLYTWFIASDRKAGSLEAMYELLRGIYAQADKLKLPVYAEATSYRNVRLYTLFGFQVYDEMDHPYGNFKVYFLKRDHNGN